MKVILNQGLPVHYWDKYIKGLEASEGLSPDLVGEVARVRGGVDALGLLEDLKAAPETEAKKPLSPEVADKREEFRAVLERCALRQADLAEQVEAKLSDEAFIAAALPEGKQLKEKQKRFLRFFIEKVLRTNARTGFAKYPTGVGKTWMMGLVLGALYNPDKKFKSLVLSPRTGLNEQNQKSFEKLAPQMKFSEVGKEADVHIGTYALAARGGELEFGADYDKFADYDLIFLDELHRGFGPGFLGFVRSRYPNAIIVGLSATPYVGSIESGNSKSARHFFEVPIDEVSLPEACEDGDITPIRVVRLTTNEDQFTAEDTTDQDLEQKMDKRERTMIAVKVAHKIPKGEKTLLNAAGIGHANFTAKELNAQGFKAGVIHSKMSETEQEEVREAFRKGEIQFLCNADMLIEGFDDVEVKHAIMLRLTKSLWIYEQMIGRACRLNEKDPHKVATIWDVVGQNSGQCTLHGLALLYNKLSELPLNGSVLFPTKKEPKEAGEPRENIQDWSPLDLSGLGDMDGFDAIVEVDSVDKVLIPLEDDYFSNAENVRKDLEAFAAGLGLARADQLFMQDREGTLKRECLSARANLNNGAKNVTLFSYLNASRRTNSYTLDTSLLMLLNQAGFPLPETLQAETLLRGYLCDLTVAREELQRVCKELIGDEPQFLHWGKENGKLVTIAGRRITLKKAVGIMNKPDGIASRLASRIDESTVLYWEQIVRSLYGVKIVDRMTEEEYFRDPKVFERDVKTIERAGLFDRQGEEPFDEQPTFSIKKMRLALYLTKLCEHHSQKHLSLSVAWEALKLYHKDPSRPFKEYANEVWGADLLKRRTQEAARIEASTAAALQKMEEHQRFRENLANGDLKERKKVVRGLIRAMAAFYGALEDKDGRQVANQSKLRTELKERAQAWDVFTVELSCGDAKQDRYTLQTALSWIALACQLRTEEVLTGTEESLHGLIQNMKPRQLKEITPALLRRAFALLKTE